MAGQRQARPPGVDQPACRLQGQCQRCAGAQVQLELGLPDDSLATATTCTQVAPEIADCWLTIGVLKQERKDNAAAADAYARYLELAPDGAYAGQVSKQLKRLRK